MCSLLRASTEHILIVRGLRARGAFALLHPPRGARVSAPISLDHKQEGHRFRWPSFFTPHEQTGLWV